MGTDIVDGGYTLNDDEQDKFHIEITARQKIMQSPVRSKAGLLKAGGCEWKEGRSHVSGQGMQKEEWMQRHQGRNKLDEAGNRKACAVGEGMREVGRDLLTGHCRASRL